MSPYSWKPLGWHPTLFTTTCSLYTWNPSHRQFLQIQRASIFFCSNAKSKDTWSAIIVPWLFMVIFVVKETTSRSCWSFSCSFPLFSYVWSPHQFYYSNVVLCTRTKLLLHSFSLALAEISLRAPWVWSALSSVVFAYIDSNFFHGQI